MLNLALGWTLECWSAESSGNRGSEKGGKAQHSTRRGVKGLNKNSNRASDCGEQLECERVRLAARFPCPGRSGGDKL